MHDGDDEHGSGLAGDPGDQPGSGPDHGSEAARTDRAAAIRNDPVGRHPDRQDEADDDEAAEFRAALIQQVSHWTGMLPRPEDLSAYPPEVQAKIIAWQDAAVLGESARRDRESEAQIRWGDRGQRIATGLVGACIASALYSIHLGADWQVSVAFLATPLMGLIALLIPARRRGPASRDD